jgi:hypothetical protein
MSRTGGALHIPPATRLPDDAVNPVAEPARNQTSLSAAPAVLARRTNDDQPEERGLLTGHQRGPTATWPFDTGVNGGQFTALIWETPAGSDAHGLGELCLGQAMGFAFWPCSRSRRRWRPVRRARSGMPARRWRLSRGRAGPRGEPSLLALPGQPEAALTGHQRRAAPLGLLCAACALDVGGAVPAADVPGYRLASVGEVAMASARAGLSATAASSAAAASRSSANRRRDGSSMMATSAPRPNSDADTANATL